MLSKEVLVGAAAALTLSVCIVALEGSASSATKAVATPTPAPVASKLTVAGLCHGTTWNVWDVSNLVGARDRNFTYQVWVKPGVWSTPSSGYVVASTTVPVVTKGGTTINVRYYNGFGIAQHTYAHAATASC